MKIFIIISLVFLVCGCSEKPTDTVVDQCLRQQIFSECLKTVPPGPTTTKYNDWDDVVDSCGNQAYYNSLRTRSFVDPKCVTGIRP